METIEIERTAEQEAEELKRNKPLKLIVAVHGIGDQFQFATIQSVANRYCVAHKIEQVLPLGKFYGESIGKPPDTYLLELPVGEGGTDKVGFTEIYWANIPRVPQKEGYTIEESKRWGKTVIDRLRPHCKKGGLTDLTLPDLEMAKGVLEEMLETIMVLERLTFIADRAGVFKFDLKNILISYLGDVQLVTDFKKYRDKILHRFFEVMSYIAKERRKAEIYIVAHSEGTVVTFLSLLSAVCGNIPPDIDEDDNLHDPPLTCEWVKQVRGLMTIGSPIDKHLLLWPDLWEDFEEKCNEQGDRIKPARPNSPPFKIQWRNYYDFGDPIGFKLDGAREWLCAHGWDKVFDFSAADDYGFGRYFFPGKAHNDYWNDDEVFDHFFKSVLQSTPIPADEDTGICFEKKPVAVQQKREEEPPPPKQNYFIKFFSNVLPYFLVVGLIALGVYFLYKSVNEYQGVDERVTDILRSVAGITCLLVGLTFAARIPRLTRIWKWRFAAFAAFAVSAVGYWYITSEKTRLRLGCFIADKFISAFPQFKGQRVAVATAVVIAIATVIAILVYVIGRKNPHWGLRIMLGLSVIGLALTVGLGFFCDPLPVAVKPDEERKLWPVFIATGAFLYLWWLAALIFDLVVVWHYYVRRSVGLDRLHNLYPKTP
jgi:hypothetical protein